MKTQKPKARGSKKEKISDASKLLKESKKSVTPMRSRPGNKLVNSQSVQSDYSSNFHSVAQTDKIASVSKLKFTNQQSKLSGNKDLDQVDVKRTSRLGDLPGRSISPALAQKSSFLEGNVTARKKFLNISRLPSFNEVEEEVKQITTEEASGSAFGLRRTSRKKNNSRLTSNSQKS